MHGIPSYCLFHEDQVIEQLIITVQDPRLKAQLLNV
jgi:hypothetical protein